ncbi:MAG: PilT/PilU family type 4a pilus ATPase [Succinivibrionaceae bacterium]|nr:PilT/PilU family type 4a pilus ATPase [Succinivibrionaceae bacterium]
MYEGTFKIDKFLSIMNEKGGSDLFLTTGLEPSMKLNGKIVKIDPVILTQDMVMELMQECFYDRPDLENLFKTTFEANFAIQRPVLGRYRVSCFMQTGVPGFILRRIVSDIPTIEQLQIPEILRNLVMMKRGLILFVGATGAGKSTTQAAMIGHRNRSTEGHILSIEDPIEYVHHHDKSIITQREVGVDTESFDAALKSSLRQAPDVILIGEIRSEETMQFALSFAETGHLCMATLHANNANQAIERIMHLVPESKHRQLLFDLSFNLRGVVAQQLVPTKDGQSRRAVFEILIGTPIVQDVLLKGELERLKQIMKDSNEQGMITFDQSLCELYFSGVIRYEDALKYADSQNDVRLAIKLKEGRHDDNVLRNVGFH